VSRGSVQPFYRCTGEALVSWQGQDTGCGKSLVAGPVVRPGTTGLRT
jgi:hypothetical protein